MQPNILIADDHSMIRKGLKLYMQLNLGYTNITEAGNCNELMKELDLLGDDPQMDWLMAKRI